MRWFLLEQEDAELVQLLRPLLQCATSKVRMGENSELFHFDTFFFSGSVGKIGERGSPGETAATRNRSLHCSSRNGCQVTTIFLSFFFVFFFSQVAGRCSSWGCAGSEQEAPQKRGSARRTRPPLLCFLCWCVFLFFCAMVSFFDAISTGKNGIMEPLANVELDYW
jgi:hypothetical protein